MDANSDDNSLLTFALLLANVIESIAAISILLVFAPCGLFLNLFVFITSLKADRISGNFRLFLLPLCVHNWILYVNVIIFPVLLTVNKWLSLHYLTIAPFLDFIQLVPSYMYRLPLTYNRFYAMVYPFDLEVRFTESFTIILAVVTFFTPYQMAVFLYISNVRASTISKWIGATTSNIFSINSRL